MATNLSTGIELNHMNGKNRRELNVHTLSLRLKSRFSLFSVEPIRIPSTYQLAVNDYLVKYVVQHS